MELSIKERLRMIKLQMERQKNLSSFEDLMEIVLEYAHPDELNWAITQLDNDTFYPKDDNYKDWMLILEFCRKDDACQEPEIIGIWRRCVHATNIHFPVQYRVTLTLNQCDME